jgi:hypothetical protein
MSEKEFFDVLLVSRKNVATKFSDAAYKLSDYQMQLLGEKMGDNERTMEA